MNPNGLYAAQKRLLLKVLIGGWVDSEPENLICNMLIIMSLAPGFEEQLPPLRVALWLPVRKER